MVQLKKVAPLVGAWIEIAKRRWIYAEAYVAPLVGAWIEIPLCCLQKAGMESLPSWERGLKSAISIPPSNFRAVAPLVGAWIEISMTAIWPTRRSVAPLVGAWIEIFKTKVKKRGC